MELTRKAKGFRQGLRKVALAGVGAAVLVKEAAEEAARTWVARGEKVEPRIRKTFQKIADQRKKATKSAGKLAERVDGRLRRVVRYLPFVTKNDLSELGRRIETFSGKVDALSKGKAKGR